MKVFSTSFSPTTSFSHLVIAFLSGAALHSGIYWMLEKDRINTTAIFVDTLLLEKELEETNRLVRSHKIDEVIDRCSKILAPDPRYASIHSVMALAQLQKKEYVRAQWHAQEAISLNPNIVKPYIILAQIKLDQGDTQGALALYLQAHNAQPESFETNYYLGHYYFQEKKFEKSLLYAQKAFSIAPSSVRTLLLLGYLYSNIGDLLEATTYFNRACELEPTSANAHYNLGNILKNDNKPSQAIPHLQKALEIQPNYPDAQIALAHCYWALGDFANAWQFYEKRWRLLNIDFATMWDGSPIAGKKILLFSEQGLGDTLQFVRYAQLLKEQGATVICRVPKPLQKILQRCPYIDRVITRGENAQFDTYAALMSLPRIMQTTAESIPTKIPYLYADDRLTAYWKQQLAKDSGLKVGICWSVDQHHELDKIPTAYRSIPATLFAQLGSIPGVTFYSLQKINGEDQLNALSKQMQIVSFGKDFDEKNGRFEDTAAVIQNLDLIISADTSIIHLAAGMGKKVWTLLPYSADCRWMINKHDSAWYPTMKLFRCATPHSWSEVMQEVTNELKKLVTAHA